MRNDEVFSRLQKLIKYMPRQKELAEKTGINQNTLSAKATRNSQWKDEEIQKLNEAYNIDIYKEEVQDQINNCVPIIYRPDVYLSAGYGVDVLEERAQTMLIDACLLVSERGTKYNPEHCEVVRISGNSMAPEYRHGDRVIINKDDTELMDGHIFAFRYKNQCYVKEINLMGDRVKCISLNKDYDPFYIEQNEDFKVFGRILPRIRL